MSDSYGEMLGKFVHRLMRHHEQGDIFRRAGITRRHYYNVINPNAKTSGKNGFTCPLEWVIELTNKFRDYAMLRKVAQDCDCLILTPDDIKALEDTEPEKTLELFHKIVGAVKSI